MKKKSKDKRRNRSNSNNSTLSQHLKIGKKLLPPMLHLLPQDKLVFSEWTSNRLPELLWASLLAEVLPRSEMLRMFFRIAERLGFENRGEEVAVTFDLTHTGLASIPGSIEEICAEVVTHPLGLRALTPLLLFEALPGRARWAAMITDAPTESDASVLAMAVGRCLDHQSQQSTDIRWLTIMFKVAIGKAHFPGHMVKDLLKYVELEPEAEEMRSIRPSIRAAEMAFRMMPGEEAVQSDWCKEFWKEALERGDCVPEFGARRARPVDRVDEEALHKQWFEKQFELVERFLRLQATSGVDARFDAIFGIALYAGNVLLEVTHGNNRFGISGRLMLRTLVECRITLAYLLGRNEDALWLRFRRFGAGQAKLALLKFDDSSLPPKFLSEEALTRIANEDISEEFLAVELGHWCDADLRKMAEFAGVKDDYDAFYGWSSAFVHGNWSAVRDASLATCINPLHRLHRVPRGVQRFLESVLEDSVQLFNKICSDVDRAYTGASPPLVILRTAEKGSENISA